MLDRVLIALFVADSPSLSVLRSGQTNVEREKIPLASVRAIATVLPALEPPLGVVLFFGANERSVIVRIFSGTSNPALAKAIGASIGVELGKCTVSSFPDGETFVKIEENVRGEDVFLV